MEYWWLTESPLTVDSLALDSLERTTYAFPYSSAISTPEKATSAEKGVCPFKYPCLFSASISGASVRRMFSRRSGGYPAISAECSVAPRLFIT